MKLQTGNKVNDCITSYKAVIGSKEAREAGFLNEDGSSKTLKKTVDAKKKRIIIELSDEEEK